MRTLLIGLLLSCLLSVCRAEKSAEKALGGEAVYQTIAQATQITAYRMHVTFTSVDGDIYGGKKIDVSEDPHRVSLTPSIVTALRKILLTDATYNAEYKFCAFLPTVKYTFETPHKKADVVLCFGCGDMEVYLDGKSVGVSPFDPAYTEMLQIAKQVFPHDQEIQSKDASKFKHKLANPALQRMASCVSPLLLRHESRHTRVFVELGVVRSFLAFYEICHVLHHLH